MRVREVIGYLALAAVALVVRTACGEWVQLPVIDRAPEVRKQQGQTGPQGPPPSSPNLPVDPAPAGQDHVGPPGPDAEQGVITIRRTVGDSFSNKEAVVVAPGSVHDEGVEDASEDTRVEDAVEPQTRTESPASDAVPEPDDQSQDQASGLPLKELREAHLKLLEQSTAPVSGKLDFLRRLKNRMLHHIASLVSQSSLSIVGGAAGPNAARAQEGRGHKGVGFPSNEGTLMSLAFLVFAVFLVKVVLQLIYAVQNSQANNNAGVRVAQMPLPGAMMPGGMGSMMGTMMNMVPAMMPPMMAAMDPATMAMRTRERRGAEAAAGAAADTVDRITANVLQAIDKARARLAELGVDNHVGANDD